MCKKLSVLLFFIVLYLNAFSQADSARVNFNFAHGDTFEIRIDQQKKYTIKSFNLATGIHFVEIWIPGIELITDTILVQKKAENNYFYRVKIDSTYSQYKNDIKSYKAKNAVSKFIPSLLLTFTTVSAINSYRKAQDDLKSRDQLYYSYQNTLNSLVLDDMGKDIKAYESSYESRRMYYYAFVSGAVLSAAWLTFNIIRFKYKLTRPVKPTFNNPFQDDLGELNLNIFPNQLTLTYHF